MTQVAPIAAWEATAHRPEAHSCPSVHGWSTTLRQPCPETSRVPGGQTQLPLPVRQTKGVGQVQEVAPRPAAAPVGQGVQGGWPVVWLYASWLQMQSPSASRSERGGQLATHTPAEHVPLKH